MTAQFAVKELELPDSILRLLRLRNISTPQQIQNFFWPKLKDLRHPLDMKGVKEGAELVCAAVV